MEIQEFFERRRWSFSIIGGLAVLRWGEPYATQHVDASLLAGFGEESTYIDEILRHFSARIDAAGPFATENRVLVIKASNVSGCLAEP